MQQLRKQVHMAQFVEEAHLVFRRTGVASQLLGLHAFPYMQ